MGELWRNRKPYTRQTTHASLVKTADDSTVEKKLYDLENEKAKSSIITDKFDATKSYVAGDYLIYNDTLYKVKVNCSGITPPNTTYYEAVTVASEVTQLKTSLNNVVDSVSAIAKSVKTVTSASNVLNINKLQLVIGYQTDGTTFAFINKGGNHTISGYFSNANQLGNIYVNNVGSHNISNVAFSIIYTLE